MKQHFISERGIEIRYVQHSNNLKRDHTSPEIHIYRVLKMNSHKTCNTYSSFLKYTCDSVRWMLCIYDAILKHSSKTFETNCYDCENINVEIKVFNSKTWNAITQDLQYMFFVFVCNTLMLESSECYVYMMQCGNAPQNLWDYLSCEAVLYHRVYL